MRRLLLACMAAALASAVAAQQQSGVAVKGPDGRWTTRERPWNASDVPVESALAGVRVDGNAWSRSVVVTAITDKNAPLHVGDLIDEVQLPGIPNREARVAEGAWPYQVWDASDFYRLAMRCTSGCLVRLRGTADTAPEPTQRVCCPLEFGYVLVGSGARFAPVRDQGSGFIDVQTRERFGPAASVVFGR